MRTILPIFLLLVVIGIPGQMACHSRAPANIKLTVLAADSLIIPFQDVEKAFEKQHPEIDVLTEGHGSIQVIRAVTELGTRADVAAVADNQLIPLMMYSTRMPDSQRPYAAWYINFATNNLGIAYTDKSPYSEEITSDNWYQIMSRPDVRTGLADPLIDSLAYRSLMSVQLAQDYYHDSTIFERLISSELTRPVTVEQAGGIATIHIPEVFKPASDRIIVRSYSLQILALLESGNVDYSFEYESVARQHGLRFLALPAEINLSAPEYAAQYQQVRVTMDFQRFASVVPEFTGGPITYAITIPENAPHLQEAIDYITFLLGPEGQRRLTTNYQPALSPAVADHPERVPNALASILR